nr:hypothetical protein [Candidatus Sigynarchaeota archaeon]
MTSTIIDTKEIEAKERYQIIALIEQFQDAMGNLLVKAKIDRALVDEFLNHCMNIKLKLIDELQFHIDSNGQVHSAGKN